MKNLSKNELNAIMGGPSRRTDLDHVGAYNFKMEVAPTMGIVLNDNAGNPIRNGHRQCSWCQG